MNNRSKVGRSGDGGTKAAGRVSRITLASTRVIKHATEIKTAAISTTASLTTKKPDPYEEAIAEYNSAFTSMNDKGLALLRQRERSADAIELVELLVNSLANSPKSFEADFEDINMHKATFIEAEEFARQDLEAARISAGSAAAGFGAGAAVASMAPTAAMWVATTFGTASTGTAISTLSGAAATNAALAWLGGGALATGGGGIAQGSALLALAGPIGWTVAGATLLASITLLARRKSRSREAKREALTAVKRNTALVKHVDTQVEDLLQRTTSIRESLVKSYSEALQFFGTDFRTLSPAHRSQLGALVNNTKACAALLSTRIQDSDRAR